MRSYVSIITKLVFFGSFNSMFPSMAIIYMFSPLYPQTLLHTMFLDQNFSCKTTKSSINQTAGAVLYRLQV